jgi:hypothetical protein
MHAKSILSTMLVLAMAMCQNTSSQCYIRVGPVLCCDAAGAAGLAVLCLPLGCGGNGCCYQSIADPGTNIVATGSPGNTNANCYPPVPPASQPVCRYRAPVCVGGVCTTPQPTIPVSCPDVGPSTCGPTNC